MSHNPDSPVYRRHKIANRVQTLILILALLVITSMAAFMLWGPGAVWGTLIGTTLALVLAPSISPTLVLSLYRARPLRRDECPDLFEILEWLAQRAGLAGTPTLHYIASAQLNALSVGSPARSAIAVTDGLLRSLNARELAGVLAHEISHLRNRDTVVMGLSDLLSRMVALLSLTGIIAAVLMWVALPAMTTADLLLALAFFAALPWLSNLLQLALSRTREFDADADAARLTGDPDGLASALQRIEAMQDYRLWLLRAPFRKSVEPSVLRSHPLTVERVARLLSMRDAAGMPVFVERRAGHALGRAPSRARWHWNGLWY